MALREKLLDRSVTATSVLCFAKYLEMPLALGVPLEASPVNFESYTTDSNTSYLVKDKY